MRFEAESPVKAASPPRAPSESPASPPRVPLSRNGGNLGIWSVKSQKEFPCAYSMWLVKTEEEPSPL